MSLTKETVLAALEEVKLPQGDSVIDRKLIHALAVEGGVVRFVLEGAPEPALEQIRGVLEARLKALEGVESLSIVIPSGGKGPQIGGHPKKQSGPLPVEGVRHVIAVGSGKGGVGKSTVSANLAVALAKQGVKVGLLDADIYGPSQPRMMGVNKRPASPDGQTILPLEAHGVTLMSIGFMLKEDEAVIWRGPMLMGALQQMLGQVKWDHYGPLDVLIIDLPPGTGDIQLSLCQKTKLDGAVIVSTPQDIALIDARKALDMFKRLETPVLGMVENMSTYICPQCGHEEHLFGHGGVKDEATRMGVPLLGSLPLNLEVRLAADGGIPVAVGESAVAAPYAELAAQLVEVARLKG
ncbi:Mrp/NBP35 family ATP-binding protein [Thioclava sp. GXIMD2076]|uniref:Iron-sulfur cluster carrier protein n=1 Tax=Thioclava kandeliae TaxID=3070818 RepID=A0ABV1SDM2_9RHOB